MEKSEFKKHLQRIENEFKERLPVYGYEHARREYLTELNKLMTYNGKI